MLYIGPEQMQRLAAGRRAQEECGWVRNILRAQYAELAHALDDACLDREIRACLARCDALNIDTDADRLSFCMLDILLFPGLRDVPGLPAAIQRAREGPGGIMANLFLQTPAATWTRLLEAARPARRARGLE